MSSPIQFVAVQAIPTSAASSLSTSPAGSTSSLSNPAVFLSLISTFLASATGKAVNMPNDAPVELLAGANKLSGESPAIDCNKTRSVLPAASKKSIKEEKEAAPALGDDVSIASQAAPTSLPVLPLVVTLDVIPVEQAAFQPEVQVQVAEATRASISVPPESPESSSSSVTYALESTVATTPATQLTGAPVANVSGDSKAVVAPDQSQTMPAESVVVAKSSTSVPRLRTESNSQKVDADLGNLLKASPANEKSLFAQAAPAEAPKLEAKVNFEPPIHENGGPVGDRGTKDEDVDSDSGESASSENFSEASAPAAATHKVQAKTDEEGVSGDTSDRYSNRASSDSSTGTNNSSHTATLENEHVPLRSEGVSSSASQQVEHTAEAKDHALSQATQPKSELKVQIDSHELGKVEIRAVLRNSEVDATLRIDRTEAQQAVAHEMPELEKQLSERDIAVSSLTLVGSNTSGSSAQQQHRQDSSQQQQSGRLLLSNSEPETEVVLAQQHRQNLEPTRDGVDLMV